MRALVLGSGMMGTAVVKDLSEADSVSHITVADQEFEAASRVGKMWASNRASIEPLQLDLEDGDRAVQTMKKHDVVIGAYPERLALRVTEYALEAGVDLVDMTALQEWEKRAEMHEELSCRGVTVIAGCGVAPGLANILMGIGTERVGDAHTGSILVGGLPQSPQPPLDYAIVFSFETVIDEYTVSPRVIRDGEIQVEPPLSGLEHVSFEPPVGEAECFLTDGLNSLLWTMPARGLKNVYEKTVRYRGHRDIMALFLECGFFDDQPVQVEGVGVTPRAVTNAVLTPLLRTTDTRDVTCMRVTVCGDEVIQYDLMDFYDETSGISSMARTTGYTCSVVAQMLASGRIPKKGFVAPEDAITTGNFCEFERHLSRRGIEVIESRPVG